MLKRERDDVLDQVSCGIFSPAGRPQEVPVVIAKSPYSRPAPTSHESMPQENLWCPGYALTKKGGVGWERKLV